MDRAPFPLESGPRPAAQAAALRRARELTVELTAVVATVRSRLAELEAAPPPADEGELEEGEMRAAFAAARAGAETARRPRWADTLVPGP